MVGDFNWRLGKLGGVVVELQQQGIGSRRAKEEMVAVELKSAGVGEEWCSGEPCKWNSN